MRNRTLCRDSPSTSTLATNTPAKAEMSTFGIVPSYYPASTFGIIPSYYLARARAENAVMIRVSRVLLASVNFREPAPEKLSPAATQ